MTLLFRPEGKHDTLHVYACDRARTSKKHQGNQIYGVFPAVL